MKTRNIVIHSLVVIGISLISFISVFLYKYNTEVRTIMEKYNPNLTLDTLIWNATITFFHVTLNIYLFYSVVFNVLFKKKLKFKNILISLSVLVFLVFVQYVLNKLSSEHQLTSTFTTILAYTVSGLIYGGIGLGVRSINEYFKNKEQKKELERKNLESEVNLLRSQINPHFLFNTLNNIDAMIRKDPEKASDLLIKLSVQMRYMLYDSNTEKIDLSSELKFIKDYIDLQKLRIKNENAVSFIVEGDYNGTMIPPMLFIPFIENAFKHCTNFEKNDAINIILKVDKTIINFEVENIYIEDSTLSKDKTGGIGVDLTKRRLDLIYAKKHQLDIFEEDSKFKVKLTINTNDN